MLKSILVLCACLSFAAHAEIHYLSPSDLIQEAVDNAADGDTIILSDGSYTETVLLENRLLVIASEFLIDGNTNHIENTVILPNPLNEDTASCFVCSDIDTLGAQIVGLSLYEGQGTLWDSRDGLTIAGGAIHTRDAWLAIRHCGILNSTAQVGGGIAVVNQNEDQEETVLIECSSVLNCLSAYWGGGIYAFRTDITAICDTLSHCFSEAGGGGGSIISSTFKIDSCLFFENGGTDAGLSCHGQGSVSNCLFDGNYVPESSLGCSHLVAGNMRGIIQRCIFRNSPSEALLLELYDVHNEDFSFVGNVIENNHAEITVGFILIVDTRSEFAYNLIQNNVIGAGGMLQMLHYPHPHIHHNAFLNNRTTSASQGLYGSAILFVPNVNFDYPVIDSNLFVGNSPPVITNLDEDQYRAMDVSNNWWGHPSGPYHPTYNPTGLGDTLLSDSIFFSPWLTEPPDTTMPSGLDPDPDYPALPGTWHIMNLFPNPFNSEFTIILAGFTRQDFSIKLYDILGREAAVVHEGALTGGSLTFVAPTDLASGVYFLRALDKQVVDTRKVVFLK